MSTPVFFALELSESKAQRILRPEVETFYYKGMYAGFTIHLNKAMRFESPEEAYAFIQKHGLYRFEVIQAKGHPAP